MPDLDRRLSRASSEPLDGLLLSFSVVRSGGALGSRHRRRTRDRPRTLIGDDQLPPIRIEAQSAALTKTCTCPAGPVSLITRDGHAFPSRSYCA